jgi:phosphoserine phosphatase
MQDYTVLPKLGISGATFWREVSQEAKRTDADEMLTYLRLLVEKIEVNRQHLTRADLRALAEKIKYFPGVERWFSQITRYVKTKGRGVVKIRHYIISAGHKEILDGASIRGHFHRVYASEYFFDHHGRATFPKVVINDTIKTQCLFRINKGKERIAESINEYTPESERPIPFSNIIYIGDGLTDVPCMTVAKKNGGHAIAVHKTRGRRSIATCKKLLAARRVDFFAPADYRQGRKLETRVKLLLDMIIAKILYEREAFESCKEG